MRLAKVRHRLLAFQRSRMTLQVGLLVVLLYVAYIYLDLSILGYLD